MKGISTIAKARNHLYRTDTWDVLKSLYTNGMLTRLYYRTDTWDVLKLLSPWYPGTRPPDRTDTWDVLKSRTFSRQNPLSVSNRHMRCIEIWGVDGSKQSRTDRTDTWDVLKWSGTSSLRLAWWIEPTHEMYWNKISRSTEMWLVLIEPTHEMYWNWL